MGYIALGFLHLGFFGIRKVCNLELDLIHIKDRM